MRKPLAAATLAGALILAPMATAHANTTEQPAPVSQCVEIPLGAPGGCGFVHNILQLLSTGSASLSGGAKTS